MRLKIRCDGESEKFYKIFLGTKQGLDGNNLAEFWRVPVAAANGDGTEFLCSRLDKVCGGMHRARRSCPDSPSDNDAFISIWESHFLLLALITRPVVHSAARGQPKLTISSLLQ